jgi:hypothetical protein
VRAQQLLPHYLRGLEEGLGALECLAFCVIRGCTDGDVVAVGQLMDDALVGVFAELLERAFEVCGDVADLLLGVLGVEAGSLLDVGEVRALLLHELHEVVSEVLPGQVHLLDGVRQRKALVDGHRRRQRVPRVKHHSRRLARCEQRQHLLQRQVEAGHVELLEHHLDQVFPVLLGVARCFGEQDGTVLGGHLQLVKEPVVPHLLHVGHVDYDSVDDGPGEVEHSLLGGDLVADVDVLLVHADHLSRLLRLADYRGEIALGRVVAGKAHLHEA